MSKQEVKQGRPPMYTGALARHIVVLIQQHGATGARKKLNAPKRNKAATIARAPAKVRLNAALLIVGHISSETVDSLSLKERFYSLFVLLVFIRCHGVLLRTPTVLILCFV